MSVVSWASLDGLGHCVLKGEHACIAPGSVLMQWVLSPRYKGLSDNEGFASSPKLHVKPSLSRKEKGRSWRKTNGETLILHGRIQVLASTSNCATGAIRSDDGFDAVLPSSIKLSQNARENERNAQHIRDCAHTWRECAPCFPCSRFDAHLVIRIVMAERRACEVEVRMQTFPPASHHRRIRTSRLV